MTELQAILSIYIACGMAYIWAEHRTYEYNYEGCSKTYIVLNMFHQLIHYTRVALTYPLYIVEDFFVYVMNRYYETEEEIPKEDE